MSTIKDVAREANVSIATVSYVLNGDSRITDKTASKVKDAIQKLNYQPNVAAQSLKMARLPLIIIVLNSLAGPIYQSFLDIMVRVFKEKNYNVLISSGLNSFNFIAQNQVMGAIILDTSVKESQMADLAKEGCVVADRRHIFIKNNVYHINYINGFQPSKEMVDIAISEGYKKFMYVHGAEDSIDDSERCAGFLESLYEHGMKPLALIQGDFTEVSGFNAIEEYLKKGGMLPDCIYSANDEMAIGIIRALNQKKNVVPKEVKIFGFDDIEISSYMTPSITSIHVNRDEWAKYIAETLINSIEKPEDIENFKPFKSAYQIMRRDTF